MVIDYAGGPLKEGATERDATSVKASTLFEQASGIEQGLVKAEDATAFKEMKQTAKAGRSSTYIGGVGLIPTGVTQAIGSIGTIVGVVSQIRADNQQPNRKLNLYRKEKTTP